MKIEIWSDVMCPFCYIGKRKFEAALEKFENKQDISIERKSFQLMPDLKTDPNRKSDEFLSEEKGIPLEHARAMNGHASQMASDAGLTFNFEKAIPANTFNAHRLIHFAKSQGRQDLAEEMLFKAYFTDGLNIDDIETLVKLGTTIGLDAESVRTMLQNGTFANDVRQDIYESQQLGVRGVPFFVFDRKYAVSGAQASEVFQQVIEKSFTEWRQENPAPKLNFASEGGVCTPDGICD